MTTSTPAVPVTYGDVSRLVQENMPDPEAPLWVVIGDEGMGPFVGSAGMLPADEALTALAVSLVRLVGESGATYGTERRAAAVHAAVDTAAVEFREAGPCVASWAGQPCPSLALFGTDVCAGHYG